MTESKKCRVCGDVLTDENWSPSCEKGNNKICKECNNEHSKQYYHDKGGKPMNENKECSVYLGIYVAERVLSHVFKNVERMPNNNKGFDFKCSQDYTIDVKSSCRRVNDNRSDFWSFHIKHNIIANFFLCIAFDNRTNLNPEHIWLIPGNIVSHLTDIGISESQLYKWDEYKLNKLDDIVTCCNTIKRGETHETRFI